VKLPPPSPDVTYLTVVPAIQKIQRVPSSVTDNVGENESMTLGTCPPACPGGDPGPFHCNPTVRAKPRNAPAWVSSQAAYTRPVLAAVVTQPLSSRAPRCMCFGAPQALTPSVVGQVRTARNGTAAAAPSGGPR